MGHLSTMTDVPLTDSVKTVLISSSSATRKEETDFSNVTAGFLAPTDRLSSVTTTSVPGHSAPSLSRLSTTSFQTSNSEVSPLYNMTTESVSYGATNVSNNYSTSPDIDTDVDSYLQHKNDEFTLLVLPAIVFLGILFVIGVLGNTLVLYIYNRRLRKGTIRWFIQALAVFDLLSCLVAIPGEIFDMRNNYTFGLSPMCKVLRTVSMFCTVASGVTLIVVAVERYKRICTPLRQQISPKVAQIIIGVCIVIAAICAAPASVIYGKQTTPTDNPHINGSDCSTADTLIDTVLPLAFSSFQCLLFLAGALALVVLYSLIGRRIWTHAKFRRVGFNSGASRRMSLIFTGSECSSPTTDEGVFTFPSRKSNSSVGCIGGGAAADSSSGSDNGNADVGGVLNNNNLDHKSGVANGYANNTDLVTDKEKDSAGARELKTSPFASANGDVFRSLGPSAEKSDIKSDAQKDEGAPQDNGDLLRQKSTEKPTKDNDSPQINLRRQNSSSKTDYLPDTLRKNKPYSRQTSRDRHRSGDSMLKGRYRRRASVHTQSDMRRFLNRSDSVNSGTRRTTQMLFLITVVYVLSFLPYLILMVIKALDKDSLSGRGDAWEMAHNILLRSYFINSMANPIVYSFCSRTFRKEASKVVHCRCCKK